MIEAGRRTLAAGRGGKAVYRRHLEIDHDAIERIARAWIAREIVQRTRTGTGADGAPMLSDLHDTGRMLGSFAARRRRRRKGRLSIDFAPDKRGRGSATNAELGHMLDRGVRRRSRAPGETKARAWSEAGDGWRIRPRHWIGLTAQQRAALITEMKRGGTIRQGQGRPVAR